MGNYRKKPVEIEAFKLGVDCIPDWFVDAVTANEVILHGASSGFDHVADTNADILTLEGWHHANYGDYIIRGVKGELYPCKPDIFDMTYDVVDKPKTNADRIRAMSDEELAELFGGIVDDGKSCSLICGDLDNCKRNNSTERICKNHYLKWLKQPAEVKEDA